MASDALLREFWADKRIHGGVAEQRALLPIITALLQRKNKQAIIACDKALKLKPYNPSVQILRAVALSREFDMTASVEATLEVANDVKGEGKALKDIHLLDICASLFTSFEREKDALETWERATALNPDSLPHAFGAALFLTRIGAFAPVAHICRRTLKLRPPESIVTVPGLLQIANKFIACTIIQANDLQTTYAKIRWPINGKIMPDANSIYASLIEALGLFNRAAPGKAGLLAENGDGENGGRGVAKWELDERVAQNKHTFYLLLKVLKHLADAPTDLKEKCNSEGAKQRIVEILMDITWSKYTVDDLQIDLFRRDTLLQYGGKTEWTVLFEEMLAKLERGDTNWATIETAIFAAYSYATGSAVIPNLDSVSGKKRKAASPDTWWSLSTKTTAEIASKETNGHANGVEDKEEKGEEKTSSTQLLIRLKDRLQELASADGFSKKERGYTLGLLKMAAFMPGQGLTVLPNIIIDYLKRYANKACCVPDLQEYLPLVNERGIETIMQWIVTTFNPDELNISTLQDLECSITIEKIGRYFKTTYGTLEEELEAGHFYAKTYFDALHFGKDLIATDLQPADDFALLAAQCYLAAWELSKHDGQYLELTIALLEFALRKSKYRFQMRVLLISLYRLAGAPLMALRHHHMLDIKQIQLDTLGHWALERGITFFSPTDQDKPTAPNEEQPYSDAISAVAEWYPNADEETSISIGRAWSNQAYGLVEDCTEFQDRLFHSLSRWVIHLESLRALFCYGKFNREIINKAKYFMNFVLKDSANARDNRDYSVLPNFQPSAQRSIVEQIRMGTQVDEPWVHRFAAIHLAFLNPSKSVVDTLNIHEEPPASCTEQERELFRWAGPIVDWLCGITPKMEDARVLQYIKDAQAKMALRDTAQPLWETLHIAQLALECYCLLDQAFGEKMLDPEGFKNLKQFKQIRQDSNSAMKAIATRLKLLAEELSRRYKGRNRLEALLPLRQYEPVSEDLLHTFATQMLESRKTALILLALRITKRISNETRNLFGPESG